MQKSILCCCLFMFMVTAYSNAFDIENSGWRMVASWPVERPKWVDKPGVYNQDEPEAETEELTETREIAAANPVDTTAGIETAEMTATDVTEPVEIPVTVEETETEEPVKLTGAMAAIKNPEMLETVKPVKKKKLVGVSGPCVDERDARNEAAADARQKAAHFYGTNIRIRSYERNTFSGLTSDAIAQAVKFLNETHTYTEQFVSRLSEEEYYTEKFVLQNGREVYVVYVLCTIPMEVVEQHFSVFLDKLDEALKPKYVKICFDDYNVSAVLSQSEKNLIESALNTVLNQHGVEFTLDNHAAAFLLFIRLDTEPPNDFGFIKGVMTLKLINNNINNKKTTNTSRSFANLSGYRESKDLVNNIRNLIMGRNSTNEGNAKQLKEFYLDIFRITSSF